MKTVAHAIALVAVFALAAAGTGGIIGYNDLQDFELDLNVVDANTGEPVSGASIEVRDANGTLIASGLTDDDGEYEMSVDDHGSDDSDDDEQNETDDLDEQDDLNDENEAEDSDDQEEDEDDDVNLGTIVGPLTVTVFMTGYETQTITVNLDTWDDSDLNVKLVPSV